MASNSWRRHARASLAFAPARGTWVIATKAAATMFVILAAAQVAGHLSLGVLASLGAFTVLYGPASPARFRIRLMTAVGTLLVASAAAGALTSRALVVEILTLTMTAAVATFFCLALRIGPPGAFFFVLVHGVGGLAAAHGTPAVTIIGAVAGGVVVAIIAGMSDLAFDPSGPERRAVEAAEAAMDRFEAATELERLADVRQAASTALHSAWTVVTDAGSAARWTDRLWEVQGRYIAATARVTGGQLGFDPSPWGQPAGGEGLADELTTRPARSRHEEQRVDAEQIRDTSLGRPPAWPLVRGAARWPSEVLLVVARVTTAALIAGAIAGTLGVPHVYWAVAFATLVLHQGGTRDAQTVRGVQRLGGTLIGLGVFALLQWAGPSGWALVLVITALQFSIEMLVVRNYGLAVIVITPLALTIGMHASGRADPVSLLLERGLDTLIGVVVALVVLQFVGRGTSVTVLRAYARNVVLGVDAVLADLASGRIENRDAREHRRLLYHDLLESDRIARRAAADDRAQVEPYREMERGLSDLGYLVLGLAWHPEARDLSTRAAEARAPLRDILTHPVRSARPADEIRPDIRRAELVLRAAGD